MAVDIYGKLYSWGKGDFGGLGTENTRNVLRPQLVE